MIQDKRYISKYRLKRIEDNDEVDFDESMKMDLFAFGVLLLETFFEPIVQDDDGTYPKVSDIDWNRIKDGYGMQEQ